MTPLSERDCSWVQEMNSQLRLKDMGGPRVLDLFCGAGGLSLGFRACGFEVTGIDRSPNAVDTYSRNLGKADCADLNDELEWPATDVIVAGPPCQPWSRAGKQLGEQDKRDGFAITLRAVQEIRPFAVVIENVPELARSQRRHYLDDFKSRLKALDYVVEEYVLNAADYSVPQNRRRIFIMAVRGNKPLAEPVTWGKEISVHQAIPETCRHEAKGARWLTEGMNAYIERYERASRCRIPRDLHLDRPSRTLTVRNLSGATGDMMRLRLPNGRRRTLTVHEAARLHSFPDWYSFQGTVRSQFAQIGNAVPPLLALAIASSVRKHIWESKSPNLQ